MYLKLLKHVGGLALAYKIERGKGMRIKGGRERNGRITFG
jgi:hypothetical protein